MLRLIAAKSRQHYNRATELVERERYAEALSELHNALELDSRFEEALLLRGVVYLRLEREPEARTAWETLLALNPVFGRAHKYLNDLGTVVRMLPVVRRVRYAVGAVVLVAVATLGTTALLLRPDANERYLRDAWALFGQRDLQAAAAELAFVDQHSSTLEQQQSAQSLQQAIAAVEGTYLDAAGRAIATRDDAAAVQAFAALERMKPTPQALREAKRLRAQAEALALEDARRVLAEAESLTVPVLERAQAQLARLVRLELPLAEVEAMRRELRAEAETEFERRERMVDEAIASAEDDAAFAAVTRALDELEALASHLRAEDRVAGLRGALAARRHGVALSQANAALERGDASAAEAAYEGLLREDGDTLPEELRAAARSQLAQLRRDRAASRLADFRAALERGDDAQAVRLAGALAAAEVPLDDADLRAVSEARTRMALAAYYALMERAERFDSGTLDAREAEEALLRIEEARASLPPRLGARAEENLLHFAIAAYRALGREEDAARALAELRARFPQSPYLLFHS